MVDDARRKSIDEPLVAVENVTVRFGRNTILRGINLAIPRGQSLVLLGESGCGKTVLMKTIIGLVRPVVGRVIYDGRDLASMSDQELTTLRTRFGFVFQLAALFDSMTIEQNVGFPLRQHTNMGRDELRRVVVRRLGEVGLPESVCSKKPAELSGGMRKRVGIARALAMNPELMLYDEPTTGLDPITSITIDDEIIKLRDLEEVSSILVTHQLRDAFYVAQHHATLEQGEVVIQPAERGKRTDTEFLMLKDGVVLFEGTARELRASTDSYIQSFLS